MDLLLAGPNNIKNRISSYKLHRNNAKLCFGNQGCSAMKAAAGKCYIWFFKVESDFGIDMTIYIYIL